MDAERVGQESEIWQVAAEKTMKEEGNMMLYTFSCSDAWSDFGSGLDGADSNTE